MLLPSLEAEEFLAQRIFVFRLGRPSYFPYELELMRRRYCIFHIRHKENQGRTEMKQVILAAALAIVVTAAQAQGTNPNSHPVQAYTTLGPAGAGVYRNNPQRDNYSTTGKVNPHTRAVGTRNPRY
jgi:hypothetical protein